PPPETPARRAARRLPPRRAREECSRLSNEDSCAARYCRAAARRDRRVEGTPRPASSSCRICAYGDGRGSCTTIQRIESLGERLTESTSYCCRRGLVDTSR